MTPTPYVTHNRHLLDIQKVCRWARELPGGERLTEQQMKRAIQNSTVFGLYLRREMGDAAMPEQIGFARVVSDNAAFSAITDVYVSEPYRRKGYGTMLMQAVVAHGVVKNTLCILQTRVPGFFGRFGFVTLAGPVMMRNP